MAKIEFKLDSRRANISTACPRRIASPSSIGRSFTRSSPLGAMQASAGSLTYVQVGIQEGLFVRLIHVCMWGGGRSSDVDGSCETVGCAEGAVGRVQARHQR